MFRAFNAELTLLNLLRNIDLLIQTFHDFNFFFEGNDNYKNEHIYSEN